MIEHCCHTDVAVAYMGGAKTWEQAKGTLSYFEAFKSCNTYTTTLHVINSAIIKLSKLTSATKLYRGVSGALLPRPLTMRDDVLTVIPGTMTDDALAEHLDPARATVIMKVGSNLPRIRRAVATRGLTERAWYVERADMPG